MGEVTEENEFPKLLKSLMLPVLFVSILWVIKCAETATGNSFGLWGIAPRDFNALSSVLTGPLIHGSWSHLINNSFPLLIMGTMILYFYPRISKLVLPVIFLVTSLLVWLFARPVYHIGASGIVYGFAGFLVGSGFFRWNVRAIALSLIVTFVYSGLFWGVMPNQPGISWESHLFGALTGFLLAYIYQDKLEMVEKPKSVHIDNREYYFARDVFDPKVEDEDEPGL